MISFVFILVYKSDVYTIKENGVRELGKGGLSVLRGVICLGKYVL